ncbi:hypothetical protein ADIS_0608 [Lunatimonas lonarensis]|uniref:Uncharacterized protein n=1 Tax=Lunatimonas lonarensis TaxID=1232681 RepID=R7ZX30_9BACT|nr:hypothetical protein ADIS_0608 [Lunatimonas lonarensis]
MWLQLGKLPPNNSVWKVLNNPTLIAATPVAMAAFFNVIFFFMVLII